MGDVISFEDLNLDQKIVRNLKSLGFVSLTNIQKLALPDAIDGKDLIVKSKTGSGKTAIFSVSLVSKLDFSKFTLQGLVLAPTRELARQIKTEIQKVAKAYENVKIITLLGGDNFSEQVKSINSKAHIMVATPGRLIKHINKKTISLDDISLFVLDEVDKLLEMGFLEDIEQIVSKLPNNRQSIYTSATYQDEIKNLTEKISNNPVFVELNEKVETIEQKFYKTKVDKKESLLLKIISHYGFTKGIIFCNTKDACIKLTDYLLNNNVSAIDLYGDLQDRDRIKTLVKFSNGSYSYVVTTNMLSRGLDLKDVDVIINYDIPKEVDNFTHRIGRVGRAGKSGFVINICCEYDEKRLDEIEKEKELNIEYLSDNELFLEKNPKPQYRTLVISSGKKDKLSAKDIVGVILKNSKIEFDQIGKIDIFDNQTFIAIKTESFKEVFEILKNNKIKNMKFRIFK